MPTALDTTTEMMQEKFFTGLEASQKAVVALVSTWAETVETVFAKMPDMTMKDPVKPAAVIEGVAGFTEKVLASQRDFAKQVFEAAMPAVKAPTAAAKPAPAKS